MINIDDDIDDDMVLAQLRKIEGISEAYKVSGIYNILVKVEAQTMDKVVKVVNYKLKNLKNIQSTLSMVATKTIEW